MDTKITQNFGVEDVDRWHKERGWDGCGYHFIIRLNGSLELGRPIEKMGSHCKGMNLNSIGVCFEGGKLSNGDKWDSPLLPQIVSYKRLQEYLFSVYGELTVSAHYQYSTKTCPNFILEDVL